MGLAMTGKGVAVRGSERHSNGMAGQRNETQWLWKEMCGKGWASMCDGSDGSALQSPASRRMATALNAMCGNGTVEI